MTAYSTKGFDHLDFNALDNGYNAVWLSLVMTCCLMVYAALEHKIRRQLNTQSLYFPNLKYKPCQNTTAR